MKPYEASFRMPSTRSLRSVMLPSVERIPSTKEYVIENWADRFVWEKPGWSSEIFLALKRLRLLEGNESNSRPTA